MQDGVAAPRCNRSLICSTLLLCYLLADVASSWRIVVQ